MAGNVSVSFEFGTVTYYEKDLLYKDLESGINSYWGRLKRSKVRIIVYDEDDVEHTAAKSSDIIKNLEIFSLSVERHQNIAKFYGTKTEGKRTYYIFEYGDTLQEFLRKNPPLDAKKAVMKDVAIATSYLCDTQFRYKDMSDEDIIVFSYGRGKETRVWQAKLSGVEKWKFYGGEKDLSKLIKYKGKGEAGVEIMESQSMRAMGDLFFRIVGNASTAESEHLVYVLRKQEIKIGHVHRHPFFWSEHKSLSFLSDVSNWLSSDPAVKNKFNAQDATSMYTANWSTRIDHNVLVAIAEGFHVDVQDFKGKDEKASFLLKAIRNLGQHLREKVKASLPLPFNNHKSLYVYFLTTFRGFLMFTYKFVFGNLSLDKSDCLRDQYWMSD